MTWLDCRSQRWRSQQSVDVAKASTSTLGRRSPSSCCRVTGYRLVLLDAGQVSECGSPTALLDDTNTRFYAMAKDAGIVTWSRHVSYFASTLRCRVYCLFSVTESLYCKSNEREIFKICSPCLFIQWHLFWINVKNCSLYTLLTATDRKPQKS